MDKDLFLCPACDRKFDSNAGRAQHFTFHDHDVKEKTLIDELLKISSELDRQITAPDADDHGPFSKNMYRSVFGTWNNALEESGLNIQGRMNISDQELLDEIHKLDEKCESTPATSDMGELGKFSPATYYDRFDSWVSAVEQAGVENDRGVSDKELISDIQELAESLGKTPTQVEASKHTGHSSATFHKHFGSWNEALVKSGFSPRSVASRNDLLNALVSLSQETSGTPTRNQMNTTGKYSAPTYQEMFGSWNEALEEADLRLNKSPDGITRSGINYGPNWSSVKEKIRTRDNNQCRICRKPRSGLNRSTHSVHHITPAREFDADNRDIETNYEEMNALDNLICLCPPCHQRVEGKFQDANPNEFAELARDYINDHPADIDTDTRSDVVQSVRSTSD